MRLIFDIETDGLLPELTKIHCLAARDLDDETKVWSWRPGEIEQGLEFLQKADYLSGHNILTFDLPAIQKCYPGFSTKATLLDTLVCSRLIRADIKNDDFAKQWAMKGEMPTRLYGSHGLEAWGYRLGFKKGDFGKDADWSVWSEEMHQYMVQDTLVNHKLWYALAPEDYGQESIDFEHDIAQICDAVGNAGWDFDLAAAADLYDKLTAEKKALDTELKTLFPAWTINTTFIPKVNNSKLGYVKGEPFIKQKTVEFNPTSRKHIEFCLRQKYDFKPTHFNPSGDAKIDETILAELPYPEAQKLARSFMLQKRLGQLHDGRNSWLKMVDADGKLRHTINPIGTVTFRASSHHPNLQQVPAVRAEYGKECRSLFGVPDGEYLVGADLSGLELRLLASLLRDGGAYSHEILQGDIHTKNQKDMGLETRDQAKVAIYSLIYGGGDKRLGEILGKGPAEGKRIRKNFTDANPSYLQLVKAAKAAVNQRGYLLGLDGRKIYCDSDFKAVNYLIQCHGALVCKKWLQLVFHEIKNQNLPAQVIAWVHDEIQIQCKTKEVADHVGNITRRMAEEAGKYYKIEIPIEAEYSIGQTWADTH